MLIAAVLWKALGPNMGRFFFFEANMVGMGFPPSGFLILDRNQKGILHRLGCVFFFFLFFSLGGMMYCK